VAAKTLDATDDLRYLAANSVHCPTGNLSGYQVCDQDARSLGSVKGVLISPSARRLAYFVLELPGLFVHRRYLLPVDAGAVVQDALKTLRISARKEELDLQSFTLSSVPDFSDDDLLRALFPA
jgi:hypothetical protein